MNSKESFEEKMRREATAIIDLQNIAIKRNAWQCCLTCEFWTPVKTITTGNAPVNSFECSKFAAMPPPHIVVTGCPDYLHNIPF